MKTYIAGKENAVTDFLSREPSVVGTGKRDEGDVICLTMDTINKKIWTLVSLLKKSEDTCSEMQKEVVE